MNRLLAFLVDLEPWPANFHATRKQWIEAVTELIELNRRGLGLALTPIVMEKARQNWPQLGELV